MFPAGSTCASSGSDDNSQEGADGTSSSPWEPDPLPPSPSISSHSPRPKPVTNYANAVEANSSAVVVGGRCLPLSSPQDATYLSPLVCLMRSQLELFSAAPEDVQARASFGKLVQKIGVGRVGMRCVHCRDQPAAEQVKGAVSYPASIRMLNQAARNWQRYHWGTCQLIPSSAREEFQRLQAGKKAFSSRKSQEYWIRQSGEMGLVDTATIRTDSSPDYTSADSSGTDGERTVEPKGIYFEDDARKLGLRMLLPLPEKASGTAKKKKEAERKEAAKGTNGAPAKHQSNKRKNTVGVSQATCPSRDAVQASTSTNTPGEKMGDFPTMHNSLSLDDFADDASLMSDLGRLAEEDENDGAGGTCDMDGTMFDTSTNSAHAPTDASNKAGSPIQDGTGSNLDPISQLLTTLRTTREMVRSLQQKYIEASATGLQIAAELHSLGEALYRTLAGEGTTSAVSSNGERPGTGDNNDERTSKRERRRDEEQPGLTSRTSLQDLGYPTSVSIFVRSLIDATDEDAVERFTSLSDVDNDLRSMIDFPDKYLLGAPPEATTGRLDMPSGLYGVQTQQSKLMNAFESVVVTGEERHGLALISGRSGSGKVSSS